MKKILSATLAVAVMLLTSGYTGCETMGLSQREASTSFADLVYGAVEQQEDVKGPTAIKFPMRLGVAQIGESAPAKELVAGLENHPELISTVIELPMVGQSKEGYYSTAESRQAAQNTFRQQATTLTKLGRQVGADFILLTGGNIDTRTTMTPLSIFDLLILPAVFLPSEKVEIEAKAAGALFDAKTGQILLLADTATTASKYSPSDLSDETATRLAAAQRGPLSKMLAEDVVAKLEQRRAMD